MKMALIHRLISWVNHNLLLSFLILTSFVFFVCTVSLGVENGNLKDELNHRDTSKTAAHTTQLTTTANNNASSNISNMTSSTNAIYTTAENEHLTGWRLPHSVIPTHYNLILNPDLQSGTFTGQIDIQFTAVETVSWINLHSKGLKIESIQIFWNDVSFVEKPERELLVLKFRNELPMGEHKMTVKFSGDMKNRIVGFYRSSYTNQQGEER